MTTIQATDLLKGLEQSLDDYCELNDEGKTAFRMAIAALELFGNAEQLPSAQPEIIRCRDCKHYHYADSIPQEQMCTCDLDGDRLAPDNYCSFAERRQDGQ